MSACESECDCHVDPQVGHQPDCNFYRTCDEDRSCDKHRAEAMAEHAWMRGRSKGACTGVMSEQDKQDMRDAGRGHLVLP